MDLRAFMVCIGVPYFLEELRRWCFLHLTLSDGEGYNTGLSEV